MKKEILEALKKVQSEMPVIGKNKEGYNYSYADLEKIWEVAKPIITGNGFTVVSFSDGNKVFVVAYHDSGDEISSNIEISNVDPQKRGAEITYYRRYQLCMLFNIIVSDEDKDAKGTEVVNEEKLTAISENLALLNTLDELQDYYKQLKNPNEKEILNLFTKRKKEICDTK